MNSQMIITSTRVDIRLLSTSLALNFCMGNIAASVAPMLSHMPDPIPTVAICTYSMVGIFIALLFRKQSDNKISNENLSV